MFDTVECPYCERENDMSEGTVDLQSDNKFEVFVEFNPVYSACKIDYVDCKECGRKTRDPCEKGRIHP